jgi:type VI secretion system protein ImpB
MPESTQKKLSRIRPPRVQITYDVEIGDATQMKELPFVAGILADLSGKPAEALPKLKDRKFVEIDRDNFNDVLASCAPRLALQVDNKLANDDSKLNVELNFRSIDDFDPAEVVKQVEPLRKLFDARQRLMDLLAKLDGNDKLDALLQEIVSNPDNQKALKASTAAPTA